MYIGSGVLAGIRVVDSCDARSALHSRRAAVNHGAVRAKQSQKKLVFSAARPLAGLRGMGKG